MKTTILNFQTLYDEYYQDIFRFAYWLSGNREDAKDIAAETFTRLWMSRETFRATSVKGYLITIARNLYLQGKRKKATVSLDEDIIDTAPPTEQLVSSKAELSLVMRKLQKLPEIDRTIVLMKTLEGLSFPEISQILGISVSSLKVKLHRSRKKLSDEFNKE
ncbi:RNA polymerase sigma factor [Aliikangiella sp. G2MR2-5]|uniref:RNA polymerase sigma factor n=1 Tax=Aliikangiella sp. G2MR2-5 TaxID=2788943 RepID=UPI0018AC6053|nr:RNA polymerase sigma factor [Aliikangiella sp. G2MR2-5]